MLAEKTGGMISSLLVTKHTHTEMLTSWNNYCAKRTIDQEVIL
jgi:hypothetical protein